MNETQVQKLREIQAEIEACFDGWDGAIKNGQQPVSIQDLDYWRVVLAKLLKEVL